MYICLYRKNMLLKLFGKINSTQFPSDRTAGPNSRIEVPEVK